MSRTQGETSGTNTTLLAGPWVGEFGWELAAWQGYVRQCSERFDKVIVVSRSGHEVLYEDFADEFIAFDCDGTYMRGHSCFGYTNMDVFDREIRPQLQYDAHLDGRSRVVHFSGQTLRGNKNFYRQKFVRYGEKAIGCGYDIVVHARNVYKPNKDGVMLETSRNWPMEWWQELLARYSGMRIATIGSLQAACEIDGYEDLRGIPLKELVNVMANSKIVISPSSGPVVLAFLCALPTVTWSSKRHRKIHTKLWNPFRTPCYYLSNCRPGLDAVAAQVDVAMQRIL